MKGWKAAGAALGVVLLGGASARAGNRFIPYDIPGSQATSIGALNDEGTVVGTFIDAHGNRHGFSRGPQGFLVLDDPAYSPGQTGPLGINDRGDIVGQIFNSGNPTDTSSSRSFYLHNGHYQDLAFPGATGTQTYGINNFGVISGYFFDTQGIAHGFILKNGTYTQIEDVPGSVGTFAIRINDLGVLAVQYVTPDGVNHSALDFAGHYVTSDVPGATASHILGINNSIAASYSYADSNGLLHAAIRLPNGKFDDIDFPGSTQSFGDDINNVGVFAGSYTNAQNVRHGYLVLPSEPCDGK
jgi:uncharacterized membrane protein